MGCVAPTPVAAAARAASIAALRLARASGLPSQYMPATSPAPPTTLPSVASATLYAYPPQVTPDAASCGSSRPIISPHMLATLCSKPAVMKVNMHHQIISTFAASSLIRAAIHTPRHTSQFASTARHSSCSGGRFIFVLATFSTNALNGSVSTTPDRTTITASSTLPTRLPTQVQPQLAINSFIDALRVSTPSVSTRLLPVNSSEPAKMTMVSAPPKQTPMTGFT